MSFAEKVNAWLTPARRQALYVVITVLAAIVAASTPALSAQVSIWLRLVMAVGIIGSLILGSIVTKSVTWTAVYRVLGVLVAALTAAGWLSGAHADMVMRIGEQFGTIAPMIAILLRTDTSTPTGSPAAEVPTVTPVAAVSASTPAATVPTASTTAGGDQIVHVPADPSQPTTTTPLP